MRIEHIALQVPDPVAMAEWYVKHLGCTIKRSGGAPAHARFIADAGGAVILELYNNPRATVPRYSEIDPLLLHIAFESANPELDSKRLVEAGATLVDKSARTPAGDDLAMLRDPWGLAVQLVARATAMLGEEQVLVYYNPNCSKCREVLRRLRDNQVEFDAINLLEAKVTPRKLAWLISLLGIAAHDLVRHDEPLRRELGLKEADMTDAKWLQLMAEHPSLIQRPIIVKGGKAILARPPDALRKFFPDA